MPFSQLHNYIRNDIAFLQCFILDISTTWSWNFLMFFCDATFDIFHLGHLSCPSLGGMDHGPWTSLHPCTKSYVLVNTNYEIFWGTILCKLLQAAFPSSKAWAKLYSYSFHQAEGPKGKFWESRHLMITNLIVFIINYMYLLCQTTQTQNDIDESKIILHKKRVDFYLLVCMHTDRRIWTFHISKSKVKQDVLQ